MWDSNEIRLNPNGHFIVGHFFLTPENTFFCPAFDRIFLTHRCHIFRVGFLYRNGTMVIFQGNCKYEKIILIWADIKSYVQERSLIKWAPKKNHVYIKMVV